MLVPVDFSLLLLNALLNPVVIVVAFWMGTSADQWQKLPLAAFAASLAGMAAVYAAVRFGIQDVVRTGRAAAGLFIAQFVFALPWAYAGYRLGRRATFLHLWLIATVALLTAMAVFAFAPVLIFVFLLIAALGLVAAAMIVLAHRLRAWREGRW